MTWAQFLDMIPNLAGGTPSAVARVPDVSVAQQTPKRVAQGPGEAMEPVPYASPLSSALRQAVVSAVNPASDGPVTPQRFIKAGQPDSG